jgi:hypothetical protein
MAEQCLPELTNPQSRLGPTGLENLIMPAKIKNVKSTDFRIQNEIKILQSKPQKLPTLHSDGTSDDR